MNVQIEQRWVRSKDGWIAGVCEGLGQRFNIEPWILRLFWFISIFWFGTGLLLYGVAALTLPREDKLESAFQKKLLGVCANLATRYDYEVGLVRFLMVLLALCSFGMSLFLYLVMALVLPKDNVYPNRTI